MPEESKGSDCEYEQYGFENKQFTLEHSRLTGIDYDLSVIDEIPYLDDVHAQYPYMCDDPQEPEEVLTIYQTYSAENILRFDSIKYSLLRESVDSLLYQLLYLFWLIILCVCVVFVVVVDSDVHEIDENEEDSQQITFRPSTSYDRFERTKVESSSLDIALSNCLKSAPKDFCLDATNTNIESRKSDSVIDYC